MNSTKRLCIASIIALMYASGMPAHAEERFTSAEFMKWAEASRSTYIRTALMTANMIAIENDQTQADCISSWYFEDSDGRDEIMYRAMETYPSYHPIGIIIAVAEKQCGLFKYGND
ncbi:hypothetical protein HNS03_08460 [Amorphus sp. 3PC139-8]